ncbi:MAG: hypothetical protein AB3N28_05395 [Kordiimonas sp.]
MAQHTKRLFTGTKRQFFNSIVEVLGLWSTNFAKAAVTSRNAFCSLNCINTSYSRIFAASYFCRNYSSLPVSQVEMKRKTKFSAKESEEAAAKRNRD